MLRRVLVAMLALTFAMGAPLALAAPRRQPYGVFVGLNAEDAALLEGYDTVVIDAQGFAADGIARLHRAGVTVYSYLNVGTLEAWRPYYTDFSAFTLAPYDDWPDEYWMDVAQPAWQAHLTGTLAGALAEKGVDGFFVDNADVYHHYPTEAIYAGLAEILRGLAAHGRPVLVNGGDPFVRQALARGEAPDLFAGVNQECVFTRIRFPGGAFARQRKADTEYFTEYLATCKEAGLQVYLTEYVKRPALRPLLVRRIKKYAAANGFEAYIARSLELDGS